VCVCVRVCVWPVCVLVGVLVTWSEFGGWGAEVCVCVCVCVCV
jgi:hypothetical protein